MVTRGVQRTSVDAKYPVPIVLRVSGGPSIIGEDLSNEEITTSIKDAIRLNACAVAMSIFVGSKNEKQTVVNLGKLVNEAEEYGIPVLAVTAVGKEMVRDARYLSLACRIAAEQGAHIVKTYYCDDFEKVVQSCPVPIIIAGGKKLPEKDALKLTHDALKAGAVGVDMGRNIWQSENPVPMIKAVRSIVHQNFTVEDAWKLYTKLSNGKQLKSKKQNQSDRPNKNTSNKNTPNKNRPNKNRPNKNRPNKNRPNKNRPNKNTTNTTKN